MDTTLAGRFEFGKNWRQFLGVLGEERIAAAEESLRHMLEIDDLRGSSFLDIGSGSGLFSLAARRLGARVHSFDYDCDSVSCTAELKRRYLPDDGLWTVEQGSVLDAEYVNSLGTFDCVYSWGVLHHTGQMWQAMRNAIGAVAPGGKLFVAIYNDMGSQSARWRSVKRFYNQLPGPLRIPLALTVTAPNEIKSIVSSVLRLRMADYVRSWTRHGQARGMSRWHDLIDWVGGYPYEVAKPDEVFDFCSARGFRLTRLKCGGVGLGCNEFVFLREQKQLMNAIGHGRRSVIEVRPGKVRAGGPRRRGP
jgi:2-polyprenyl-3-methyl-5-hydroxy-6-metoxy-1,4-benzoquinol methylase